MAEGTILQIIPAPGWRALYFDTEASIKSKTPIIRVQYLACWALFDSGIGGVSPRVVGLITEGGDLFQATEDCEPPPLLKPLVEMASPPNIFMGYSAPEQNYSTVMKTVQDLMFDQMKELGLTE